MFRRSAPYRLAWGSLIACAAMLAPTGARAEQPAALHGVLVLRNGNVLRGAVRRYGDDYRIAVDDADAQLQVPSEHVEMFARTLDEAYEAKRRGRTGLSADSHLELARWCLRHDLLNHAARELLDARTLDPRHPGLAPLATQLRELLDLASVRDQSAAAAAEPPRDAVAPAPPHAPTDLPPEVSVAAQAQFVRVIQPMLVNGCTMRGCHQPGSAQKLQLDRWALQGNGNVDLVRSNLSSVLAQVDIDEPRSSPLLKWARTAHGKRSGPPSRPLAAYQTVLVLEWLDQAAGVEPAPDAPPPSAIDDSPVPQVGAAAEQASPSSVNDGAERGMPAERSFEPRDEFDPEIFNRRVAAAAVHEYAEAAPDVADQPTDPATE